LPCARLGSGIAFSADKSRENGTMAPSFKVPLIVHILFLSGTINSTLRHCQIDAGTITTSDLNRTEQPWAKRQVTTETRTVFAVDVATSVLEN